MKIFSKLQAFLKPEVSKVVILGAGEVGVHLAKRLSSEDKNVIVIDKNPDRIAYLKQNTDVQTVLGSGSSPQILEQAEVSSADFFLAVTNDDEVNLVACLFANHFAPKAVKLARISNQEYTKHPDVLGGLGLNIQVMVHPEQEVVRSIDRLLSLPGAQDYAEFARGGLRMVAYKVENTVLVGKPLTEFRTLAKNDAIMVAAIIRGGNLIIPSGKDTIKKDDLVYFAYQASAQADLLRLLGRARGFFDSVCIVGGGKIGLSLARVFAQKGRDVKLIEKDSARCEELADLLDDVLILHGDATERSLLIEENIGKMDVIISVTSDEETNILACLLGKSLGTRDTVVRVSKTAYLPIVKQIGIDHCVSTRLAAVNGFLSYIRKGHVVASASLASDAAEVLEARLSDTSPLIEKAIKDIFIPKHLILLAVKRNDDVFIPNGSTVLHPGDHVVFLAEQSEIHELEPLLGTGE